MYTASSRGGSKIYQENTYSKLYLSSSFNIENVLTKTLCTLSEGEEEEVEIGNISEIPVQRNKMCTSYAIKTKTYD